MAKKTKHFVKIRWGHAPEKGRQPAAYYFNSRRELEAFIHGIDQACGWMGFEIRRCSIPEYIGYDQ